MKDFRKVELFNALFEHIVETEGPEKATETFVNLGMSTNEIDDLAGIEYRENDDNYVSKILILIAFFYEDECWIYPVVVTDFFDNDDEAELEDAFASFIESGADEGMDALDVIGTVMNSFDTDLVWETIPAEKPIPPCDKYYFIAI